MGNLNHLATRIFGVPLLIERAKMDVILAAIGPRLGVVAEDASEDADGSKLYGPGDTGRNRKSYFVTEDKIAVIDVVGPLVKRNSGSFMSGGPTSYGEIETEFMDAATDPDVKGIMLQIDSPGGESTGAFELSDLIHSQRGSKPIFAAADGDAFSAAYAIASAADRVYVTKSGGVGSVGVWMMHVDQSGFNAKVGVKPTFIFAGARKIDGNPHAPLSDDARETFQAEVDRIYGMFVDTVARNRAMDPKAIRKTEAGLFWGEQGVEVGFADQVGTMSDAMVGLRAAIARKSSSSAAASAASQNHHKEERGMPEETQADATKTTAVTSAPAPEPAVATPDPGENARTEALAYAADVAELCTLAGMPARAASFIRANKSIEDVRTDLLAARAASDAETAINSHVLPQTGAEMSGRRVEQAKTNTEDSPLVKAAEAQAARYAAARKEK